MAAKPRGKRALTPVGRSWLRGLYEPAMKMPEAICTVVFYFDKCPDKQTWANEFERHLWPLYRFSSTVVDDAFVPVDGPMDSSYHFIDREVEDEPGVTAFVQSVMATPLQRDRPLWRVYLLRAKRGRSAVIFRMHHCITDGIGALFAILPMLSCKDGDVLSKIRLPAMLLGKEATPRAASGGARAGAVKPHNEPKRGLLSAVFSGVLMFFRGVFSILAMKDDSEFRFGAPKKDRKPFLTYSGRHTYTRMPPVPAEAIKAVRAAHGCTFNDAVMAALAGAFRRYGISNVKDPVLAEGKTAECKAFMLIALPRPIDPKDASVSLANNILTPVFRLPIDEPNAAGRLRATVAACNDLKSKSYLLGIKFTTKLITSIVPVGIMRKLASDAISKATCNVSNMPLPDVPVTIAGEEVKEVQVVFVNNIPQITLLSYGGCLCWNLICDPEFISDPMSFGKYFLEEFGGLGAKS